MPYTNDYSSHSNWSAVLDGFVQLVQIATAAVSAKILQDPDARAVFNRGYVVPYAGNAELRDRAYSRVGERLQLISTEYTELYACFEKMHAELHFTRVEAHSLTWDQARDMNLAHDCLEFDRYRQQITQYLTQCAILHAQMVCSVTEYLENIHTAYICPPNYCNPGIPPFGDMPQPPSTQTTQTVHAQAHPGSATGTRGSAAAATHTAQAQQHPAQRSEDEDDHEQTGARGRRPQRSS